jgi:hypothetical protein
VLSKVGFDLVLAESAETKGAEFIIEPALPAKENV